MIGATIFSLISGNKQPEDTAFTAIDSDFLFSRFIGQDPFVWNKPDLVARIIEERDQDSSEAKIKAIWNFIKSASDKKIPEKVLFAFNRSENTFPKMLEHASHDSPRAFEDRWHVWLRQSFLYERVLVQEHLLGVKKLTLTFSGLMRLKCESSPLQFEVSAPPWIAFLIKKGNLEKEEYVALLELIFIYAGTQLAGDKVTLPELCCRALEENYEQFLPSYLSICNREKIKNRIDLIAASFSHFRCERCLDLVLHTSLQSDAYSSRALFLKYGNQAHIREVLSSRMPTHDELVYLLQQLRLERNREQMRLLFLALQEKGMDDTTILRYSLTFAW